MSHGDRQRCIECGKKMKRCLPVIKHTNGLIDYVCRDCWAKFDYGSFMEPRPKPEP